MKSILTLGILFLTLNSFAQTIKLYPPETENHKQSEISLMYNFGFPTRNFKLPSDNMSDRLDYRYARSYYDHELMLGYKYSIINKNKNRLSIGTGIGYTDSQHYQIISDYDYSYLLENVVLHSKSYTAPFTVGYEREMDNGKFFLGLNYSMNFNFSADMFPHYSNEVKNKYGYIDYSYDVHVFNRSQVTHTFSVTSKLMLKKNLFLSSAIGFLTCRKMTYNYTFDIVRHLTDEQTGITTNHGFSYESLPNIELKDSYVNLSLGLAYKF